MNILYSGDANIADGVIISVLSLCHAVKEPLNIYILTATVSHGSTYRKALQPQFATFLEEQIKKYNNMLHKGTCKTGENGQLSVSRRFIIILSHPSFLAMIKVSQSLPHHSMLRKELHHCHCTMTQLLHNRFPVPDR